MKSNSPHSRQVSYLLAIFIAVLSCIAPTLARAGDSLPLSARAWTLQLHPGGADTTDYASALKVGPDGTLYLSGYSLDQYFTMALSREGVPLWTNYYSGVYSTFYHFDIACDLSVDNHGNAYVSGYSTSFDSVDTVTLAYSRDGTPLWTNSFYTLDIDVLGRINEGDFLMYGPGGISVCADSSGLVYLSTTRKAWAYCVAYSANGTLLWENGSFATAFNGIVASLPAIEPDSKGDIVAAGFMPVSGEDGYVGIACVSPEGALLWTNAVGAWIGGLAIDSNDRIYVANESIVAYSNLGSPIWTNRYSSSGSSYSAADGLATGPQNQIYVTGMSGTWDPAPGTNFTWTLAYNSDGIPLWTNTYPGFQEGSDYGSTVASDPSGNVYVIVNMGYSRNYSNDWATIAYDRTGRPMWTNVLVGGSGPGSVLPKACMAVSHEGEVYVAGRQPNGSIALVKYVTGFAPTITTQPQGQVVTAGDNVALQLSAKGTEPLFFHWSLNGNDLQETSGPELLLTNVSKSSEGLYSVTVSNLFGTVLSSNAFLRVNLRPVADASATPTLLVSANGSNVAALLDGSHSYDPDGDSLQYSWFLLRPGASPSLLANGMTTTAVLPLGNNQLNLVVSDGFAAATNSIAVAVLTPAQAVERLVALVNVAGLPHSQPLLATLDAALATINRGDRRPAANQLAAFQNKAQAQGTEQTLLRQLTMSSQQIVNALIGP
jgi:hypothetical protein